jgi:hypothetical protein
LCISRVVNLVSAQEKKIYSLTHRPVKCSTSTLTLIQLLQVFTLTLIQLFVFLTLTLMQGSKCLNEIS